MKKAEMFSYILFSITLFSSLTFVRFYGMNIITAMLGAICGVAFTCCFIFHEKKED